MRRRADATLTILDDDTAPVLTILDDDTAPVLTLEVAPATIAEDGGTATVTVTTGTGSTFGSAQAITLVLGGTATQGGDYTVSATQLTLPAGAASVTATVTGLDDGVFEGDETLLISGQADGAAFGEQQTLTITDNEGSPQVTLVLSPGSIAEDGGVSTVTATVSPAPAGGVHGDGGGDSRCSGDRGGLHPHGRHPEFCGQRGREHGRGDDCGGG